MITKNISNSKTNLLSLPQAARITGYSRVEMFRKVKRGEIPARRIGRSYFVQRANLGPIYAPISQSASQTVDRAVAKTLKDFGETIKLLGKE